MRVSEKKINGRDFYIITRSKLKLKPEKSCTTARLCVSCCAFVSFGPACPRKFLLFCSVGGMLIRVGSVFFLIGKLNRHPCEQAAWILFFLVEKKKT